MNTERNKQLHELWRLGHTIEAASVLADVPRSTVGYYFRKFDKKYPEGRLQKSDTQEPVLPEVRKTVQIHHVSSIILGDMFLRRINDLIEKEGFMNAYYFLMFIKLLKEFSEYLNLTPEEFESLVMVHIMNSVHQKGSASAPIND